MEYQRLHQYHLLIGLINRKTLMTEYPKVKFIKVNPDGNSGKTPVSSPINEWAGLKNLEYMSFERTLDKFSKIDILVNNAGITRDTLLMRMKEEDWDAVLTVNLKRCF